MGGKRRMDSVIKSEVKAGAKPPKPAKKAVMPSKYNKKQPKY